MRRISSEVFTYDNSLSGQHFNGSVKEVHQLPYNASGDENSFTIGSLDSGFLKYDISLLRFNEEGLLIYEQKGRSGSGSESSIRTFYDRKNRIASSVEYRDTLIDTLYRFEYHRKGCINVHRKPGIEMKILITAQGDTHLYEVYKGKERVQCGIIAASGAPLSDSCFDVSPYESNFQYFYNNGVINKRVWSKNSGDTVDVMEYNMYGYPVKWIVYNEGVKKVKSTWKYVYDHMGNWIQKVTIYEGKASSAHKRDITYYE